MRVDAARVVRVRYSLVSRAHMLRCDIGRPIYAIYVHDGSTRIDCMCACLQRSEERLRLCEHVI